MTTIWSTLGGSGIQTLSRPPRAPTVAGYKRAPTSKREKGRRIPPDIFLIRTEDARPASIRRSTGRAASLRRQREDFAGAMAILASLRTPIDRFFENVKVNDADADKRETRLILLSRIRNAIHKVADFSKIEG